MSKPILYADNVTYSYEEFDIASNYLYELLGKELLHSNCAIMVISSKPELYYFTFYFCQRFNLVYCPLNIDDTIEIISKKIEVINPDILLSDDNYFYTHQKNAHKNFEVLILPAIGLFHFYRNNNWYQTGSMNKQVRYILFTSGTTGAPKGVAITNQNLQTLSSTVDEIIEMCNDDIIANTFKFSFDLSILVMLLAWKSNAAIVHISGDDILSGNERSVYSKVSILPMIPSIFRIFKKNNSLSYLLPEKVRYFLFCGDPLYLSDIKFLQKYFSGSKIYNLYGPTELTIFCSYYLVPETVSSFDGIVCIGKLNHGCKAYLEQPERVSDNVLCGELCIAGEQNFVGYTNGIHEDKFIEFNDERYYKTGDRVMYKINEDQYYYLQRIDKEIKYHGHRINLSYIENCFNNHEKIRDSAAVYSKKYMNICLFYMADIIFNPEDDIHFFANIPSYLRPTHFFKVSSFPLNANAKKDYQTLEHFYHFYLNNKHEN